MIIDRHAHISAPEEAADDNLAQYLKQQRANGAKLIHESGFQPR